MHQQSDGSTRSIVELRNVSRIYGEGPTAVHALIDVNLTVARGEFVAITGPSGSGKSTCMNVLGCLDTPSSGEYWLDGIAVGNLAADQRALIRRSMIGFVFQGFNLLARTTAAENVELPLIYRGMVREQRHALAMDIGRIMVVAQSGSGTAKVQRAIELLLRERRKIVAGKEDDFSVIDMKQIARTTAGATMLLTGLLAAVAAVSLLVGGIGIMNIMLVSVTERTREIGIRLAIGASQNQVLSQFLTEAVVLSLLGGVTGIALGLGIALAVTTALQVPFIPDLATVSLSFAFSAFVGVLFGYLPARKAALMNPIEALRHE